MKGTISEKILRAHLMEGELKAGEEIGIKIDQTLTQDATGTMVYLEFESLHIPKVKVPLAVSYVDHNLVQTDFKNADDHLFLKSSASKYGVILSPPGNGVSHHVHRDCFGKSGQTLLGSDSHTTTGGCLGMLALGAGGVEVAMAMAGHPYHLNVPLIWGVYLENEFSPFVSGKDLILTLLKEYRVKGGLGKIMEFYGPGVLNVDIASRTTIANMAVDMGLTAAIFPSDEVTREHFRMNGRLSDWMEVKSGDGAEYDIQTNMDLSKIEPMVACPSNPDNVRPAKELADVVVRQVIIGSSCNGSYRDLMIAAEIMKGRSASENVSFEINPGSRQVLVNATEMGGIGSLLEAGARVHQSGCLGCIGMGQAPASGTNSLRTFPRNFKGRSGTLDDHVYLCSPETAAASALTGHITDPRTLGTQPKITFPEIYSKKDHWLIQPKNETTEIERGPNIMPLPVFPALENELIGEVIIKVGDDISTDIIMPAGNRVLPFRSNIPKISNFVFDTIDPTFAARALEKGGGFVVGGENYGQGSSREHAALAPRYLGIRAKIVKSFARIHKQNLINFGILPLEFINPEDYGRIAQGESMRIENILPLLKTGATEIPVILKTGVINVRLDVSERHRNILIAGGLLNIARE